LATTIVMTVVLATSSLALLSRPALADPYDDYLRSTAESGGGLVVLPGVNYSPESGVSVGAALMRYFRIEPKIRPSRVVLQGQYAFTGDADLRFSPEIWFSSWAVKLSTSVERKDHDFFGIGNDTELAMQESYLSHRFDGRLEVIHRMPAGFSLGALYAVTGQRISDTEPDGLLASGMVSGSDGGLLSGVGLALVWDRRDNAFAPHRGFLLTATPLVYDRRLGSDHDFRRLALDGSVFVNPWAEHVIAIDARLDMHSGDTPFDELGLAGGSRYLRGMLKGRFRDRHFATAQVEYRLPLFWRLGGVAFGGLGQVAGRLDELRPELDAMKYSVGGGLRFIFDRKERIHIRGDVAKSTDQTGVYISLLEAF
jgi:outer membrane protein assembly factor BamA